MKTFPHSLLPVLALLLAPASAWAQQITKNGDDYDIKAPSYNASVDGKTGLLKNMTVNGMTVVESTAITLDSRVITGIAVSQDSPTTVSSVFAAQQRDRAGADLGEPSPKALRVSYEAQPTTLIIKVYATAGPGRGLLFNIGKDAQQVRSLDFKEVVPVPVTQARSPWTRVKYLFSNGAALGILNQGAGHPLNANENGSVSAYTYARRGFIPNSEYTYSLIVERPGKEPALPLYGSPAMTVAEAKKPSAWFRPDVPTATLQISKKNYEKLMGRPGLKIKYRVEDAWEKEVLRGEMPLELTGAETVEVKVPLPVKQLGWYRAFFAVNDAQNLLLESNERLIFSLLQPMPNMGQGFDNIFQTNYTIGLGFVRENIPDLKRKNALENMLLRQQQAAQTDVFLSYAIDESPRDVGADPVKFGAWINDYFAKAGQNIPRVEIINEPNGRHEPKFYMETFLRPAYENIKKVSPNTKVMGPVLVGISPDSQRYLSELYKLGLKDVTDELTFHPYSGNFDDGNAVESMQRLQQVIAANGDANKPLYFTEAGYNHGGWSNLPRMREVIKLLISQYAWQDAVMGIDYRHNLYYFTDSMGYYDFWLRQVQLTPAAVAMRNYTSLVKGQKQAQQMSFGSREVLRAFLYPGETKQVVALWTSSSGDGGAGENAVFTTDAKSVQWLDCFGNPLPAKIEKGKLQLKVPTYPTYLVFDGKPKIAAVPENWGANLALASLGATAEASTEEGTLPAISAIDGNVTSGTNWRSLAAQPLPQSMTVNLAGPAQINRAGIWSYDARGYDLEARAADGSWKKLVSRRDQPRVRFREETFAPITTDQFRLTVVDSFSDRADVAELQLFSAGAAAGSDLVNWASKERGATARASSELSKEVTVAEQAYGAKEAVITKVTLAAKAENAIDGKRLIGTWREFFPTTWMAAKGSEMPQWLEIDFGAVRKLSSVAVYTIAFQSWTPDISGIRDWQVQIWKDGAWQTVDTVTDNVKVSKVSRFATPVQTDKIRILVTKTNDEEGNVGIMEVQAFGLAK